MNHMAIGIAIGGSLAAVVWFAAIALDNRGRRLCARDGHLYLGRVCERCHEMEPLKGRR